MRRPVRSNLEPSRSHHRWRRSRTAQAKALELRLPGSQADALLYAAEAVRLHDDHVRSHREVSETRHPLGIRGGGPVCLSLGAQQHRHARKRRAIGSDDGYLCRTLAW